MTIYAWFIETWMIFLLSMQEAILLASLFSPPRGLDCKCMYRAESADCAIYSRGWQSVPALQVLYIASL